jgi:hypothetical protein
MSSKTVTILVKQPLRPKEHGIAAVTVANDRRRNSKRWRMRWMLWSTKMPPRPRYLACLVFQVFLLAEVYPDSALVFCLLPSPVSVPRALLRYLCHFPYPDSMVVCHHRLCLACLGWIPIIPQTQRSFLSS